MSLLLDALKKAAEKKAKKSGDHHENVDPTEVAGDTTISVGQVDETDSTQASSIDHEATHVDDTALTEATLLEHEDTHIDDTDLVEATLLDHEAIHLDDNAFTETAQIDNTQFDNTVFTDEASSLDHDPTQLDETELTEAAFGHEQTQLDHEETVHNDTMELGAISIEDTAIESAESDFDTKLEYQTQFTDEDSTLIITDDDEQKRHETDETTQASLTDADTLSNTAQEKEVSLTEDDVTQFMGDGHTESNVLYNHQQSGDTTITNPESLTLTNFSFADDHQTGQGATQDLDKTESGTFSLRGHDGKIAADLTETEGLIEVDSEREVVISEDSTSTVSSIDIEKLTDDETVTVESGASTRTFAPDNYDRTLLNLSENDASKIFPGLRPESNAVMTPDYAKKVFQSKSGQVKTPYYKMYAGIGLLLLLAVMMWGLFELQSASDLIDQRLISLKRDPMPGIIKPPVEKASPKLFTTGDKDADSKVIDIIAKADQPESDLSASLQATSEELSGSAETDQQAVLQAGFGESTEAQPEPVKSETVEEPKKTLTKPVVIAKAGKAEAKKVQSSPLMISTSSQVSEKDLLLIEAYKAYKSGDMDSARSNYDQVLSLDDSNRDGILGRAAIHVQDNEYQQAINKYQQLLLANPKDSMAITSLISVANIDPKSAETQIKTLLREQPEAAYLHFALGNMYGSQSRWSEAQNAYFDALQNKPEDPNYAYNLAVSLEHIGKTETAGIFYQRALENSSKGHVTFDSQRVKQRLQVLSQ